MEKHKIIGELFLLRDLAHLRHLQTTSYAEHIALEEFYTALLPLIDQLAEVMQQRHTLSFSIPNSSTGLISTDGRINIFFDAFKGFVKDHEYTRAENNILDDIFTLIDQTKYKLNNLV